VFLAARSCTGFRLENIPCIRFIENCFTEFGFVVNRFGQLSTKSSQVNSMKTEENA